jgi:hypothetical protein
MANEGETSYLRGIFDRCISKILNKKRDVLEGLISDVVPWGKEGVSVYIESDDSGCHIVSFSMNETVRGSGAVPVKGQRARVESNDLNVPTRITIDGQLVLDRTAGNPPSRQPRAW